MNSTATPPQEPTSVAVQSGRFLRSGKGLWLIFFLVVLALLLSVQLWRKLNFIQGELAKRSSDAGAQAMEARVLAKEAQERALELAARLSVAETRLSEVSLQRSQFDELLQSVSRSRDENMVVDLESSLRLAQQQAQLTGSAQPLLAALRSADVRLSRAAQPRLNPLQRAIARDIDRIKAANVANVPDLLLKLDELIRMMDDLPLLNGLLAPTAAASAPRTSPKTKTAAWTAWWERSVQSVRTEVGDLLRVSRIEQPEAVLLAPEQAFFLHENLKLRLLNVRLDLMSRQIDTARTDLALVQSAIAKYFDSASHKTRTANGLLGQVLSQIKSTQLPHLDATLAALTTAAAGR